MHTRFAKQSACTRNRCIVDEVGNLHIYETADESCAPVTQVMVRNMILHSSWQLVVLSFLIFGVGTRPSFFDDQLGSAVAAIDYVRGRTMTSPSSSSASVLSCAQVDGLVPCQLQKMSTSANSLWQLAQIRQGTMLCHSSWLSFVIFVVRTPQAPQIGPLFSRN